MLDSIDTIWRSRDMALCKARDRGAMIEAICALYERDSEGLVFVWNPGQGIGVYESCRDFLQEEFRCSSIFSCF